MMEGEGYCTGEEESDSVASIRPSSSHKIGKKKRFSEVQIRSLEKIFENETTRLEPWKKVQLAMELGLHPRQIAIWFQNRRARWKTKRVEKDYGLLQADYDALLASFESLKQEKQALLEQAHLADFKSLSQRSPPEHKPVACMHEQDACSCEIEKLSRLLEKQPQSDSGKKRAWCENSVDGCSENGDRKPDCQKDVMVGREGEPDMRSSLLSDSECSKAMGKVRKDVEDQDHQDGVAEEINGYACGPFCFPGRSYGLESSLCCYPDQTWQWPWELWP